MILLLLFCLFWKPFNTLHVELSLQELLLQAPPTFIADVLRTLTIKLVEEDDGTILRLLASDYLRFNELMPSDDIPLLKRVEKYLKPRGAIQMLKMFYNFKTLQDSDEGRDFLISTNANFAQNDWIPFKFTVHQVTTIFDSITTGPQEYHCNGTNLSWILYLPSLLSKFSDISINERLLLLFDSSFLINQRMLESTDFSWFIEQVKPFLPKNDLLFYRLAILYRWLNTEQRPMEELRDLLRDNIGSGSMEAVLKTSRKLRQQPPPFRQSVLKFLVDDLHIMAPNDITKTFADILETFKNKSKILLATFHFEHYLVASLMGIRHGEEELLKLFRKFPPSQVSPHICKFLFMSSNTSSIFFKLVKRFPKNWENLYERDKTRQICYFPRQLLPSEAQKALWQSNYRHLVLYHGLYRAENVFPISPLRWREAIQRANFIEESKRFISKSSDGFTRFNCQSDNLFPLMVDFLNGRIYDFLLNDRPLPKFKPFFQPHEPSFDKLSSSYQRALFEGFCEPCEKTRNQPPPTSKIFNIVGAIEKIFHTANLSFSLYESISVYNRLL